MLSRTLAFACIVCTASIGTCAVGPVWIVRPDGIGPVRVGMTLTELNSVLHESFTMPADKEQQPCFYVNTDRHPGVGFMIQNRRVVRVDVDGPDTPTVEGVRVGDSEAKAMRAYGSRLNIEPNYYQPQEKYLTIRSANRRYAIRFETDNGKIGRFYAGRLSAVLLIEGCS